jgi:small-conductance mechanosensitive channel
MGKQLELPATLFFWWLGVEVSFLPTMRNHQADGSRTTQQWMGTMNKVLVSIFVGTILNFVEKVIIQLIAISFHLRTYADRIELNKFQIGSLVKLYTFSKAKIAMEDSEFEQPSGINSGTRTPGQYLQEAQKQTKEIFNKVGDVAGRVAGDFTGKAVAKSTHPHQVVLALLSSTNGSQVLARRLYRTFARPETETVYNEDLKNAFDNDEEADAAFSMFDKDMNGDISMEELEAVCVEIGRERKSITASLKDLDSVVGKLDDMLMFLVFVITILVFISLISTSAAGVLTSAGSTMLGLSWLFSATATEILQSIIFVFVKHPFDVGDRVTIYGNTGATLTGDDYFVKEIALLYTEFKKMEGHVVQAPNSYLNTLFILNQRRSGGLAEAVPVVIKFGTTLEQIEALRHRLLEFVKQENREYQGNILTELRAVTEVHSLTLNVVFFYKSNWQNEGLRLARRNKFICALMVVMQECGIEGPRMRFPGQKESFPVYMQNIPHQATPGMGRNGHPDNPTGWQEGESQDPPFVAPAEGPIGGRARTGSILLNGSTRLRAGTGTGQHHETLAQMGKRVDFSLGMRADAAANLSGDVFEDEERKPRLPVKITSPSPDHRYARKSHETGRSGESGRSTSRDIGPNNLARRNTDTSTTSISRVAMHRNRFFGGRGRSNTIDEHASNSSMMEKGMADIPEDRSPAATISNSTIDPRSGLVSGAAWRTQSNETNVVRKSQERPRTSQTFASRGLDGPAQMQAGDTMTEDFEMRRLN